MGTRKILTTILFCLSIAPITPAAEVISIDFNGKGDNVPYTGEAAIADQTVWRAFDTGFGVAVGSERTSYLSNYDQPDLPSTYAAQVWIGDNGLNHDYILGSDLMDDGFDANGVTDPYISFITSALNPVLGAGAYTGTFDMYVYGSTAGIFTLTVNAAPTAKCVTGGFNGTFIDGQNYVVFPGVNITPGATITLTYTGMLNGLQLVSDKTPVQMIGGSITKIPAKNYDVAHETNGQVGAGSSSFGPDITPVGEVTLLDAGEYMIYDINVDDANEGQYELSAWLYEPMLPIGCTLEIYLDDDIYLGDLTLAPAINPAPVLSNNSILFNLFAGNHTIKWRTRTLQTFILNSFDFDRKGPVVMDDCNDVYFYQLILRADNNKDCHVDINDLNEITSHWAEYYSADYGLFSDANTSYYDEVMTDDPALYLRFDEYPFVDSSGNDYWVNSSQQVTIEKVKGSLGNAAHINTGWIAAANQQTAPSLPTVYNHSYAFSPNDLTVEFWLYYPDSDEDILASLFTQCDDATLAFAPGATRAMDQCRMLFGDNATPITGYAYTDANAWGSDNTIWHHHVVIWDEIPDTNGDPCQINVRWYRNGELCKNSTYGPADTRGYLGPEMDHILIGRMGTRSAPAGSPYMGYIDEFAIYPYVLPPERIQAHYDAWAPNYCWEIWSRQILPDHTPTKESWQINADMDQDCRVDLRDFAYFAYEWFFCNDPQGGPGCAPNW
jgi:hypothetical protein